MLFTNGRFLVRHFYAAGFRVQQLLVAKASVNLLLFALSTKQEREMYADISE